MELELLTSAATWLKSTALSSFVTNSDWAWYTCEILHFIGLVLLIGAVGMLDLRVLGVAKDLPVGPLHRLVPWGVFGFLLCVVSGTLFVVGEPFQFLERGTFQLKMLFILIAGINVLVFYLFMFRDVEALGPGDDASLPTKAIAAFSLFLWIGVIYWGRLLGIA
jgi:hypothetical protein